MTPKMALLATDATAGAAITHRRTCNHCGRRLPMSCFYKNPSSRSGLDTACKSCRCLRHRQRTARLQRERAAFMASDDHDPSVKILYRQNPRPPRFYIGKIAT